MSPGSRGRPRTAPTRGAVRPVEARLLDPRGRAKVYRPLDAAERNAAFERGLAAYARGAFYLAHEELEPAWMGTADPDDRELLGGLIKLSAAFVHAVRGNPAGVRTNLRGARVRLAGADAARVDRGLDLPAIIAAIDGALDLVERGAAGREEVGRSASPAGGSAGHALRAAAAVPDPPHDVAGPRGRARGAPLDLHPPALDRRSLA